ncbi:hypothetical protein PR202_ga27893 [Eleusine coracana subsp. coracana]|uniref:Uncharacterized protein n=1 Tax=Eleusine coracana subsp. coracana TaxID=191504 RepID=A0AAV5DHW3_ELECO|nr:hypothetical protein PR202_ga27893 [Eleusine coracana subsp. coracana]
MDVDVAAGGGGGGGSTGGGGTSIHITALDGIVNVNSLFTLAAFIGLAWRPAADGIADGADRLGEPCAAGDRAESDLVSFHVLAFACFLFSSLVALCLKQLVRTYPHRIRGSSAAAGVVGRTARINRARAARRDPGVRSGVKLGRLGCGDGGSAAWAAVVPLVTLVPAAMLIYIGVVSSTHSPARRSAMPPRPTRCADS